MVMIGVLLATAWGGLVMDDESEYIMIYANATDKGTYYGSDTKEFATYFASVELQTAITEAKNELAEKGRTITATSIVDDTISAWNEMGYLGPHLTVTDEDLALVPKVEDLYNTDGDFTGVPNIVFIMLDDAGWNDVDLGLVSTKYEGLFPNINGIVKDGGITLTNYLTGTICAPARGMFLTGRYSSILDMDGNAELQTEDVTLAHELKSAGYSTALIGKYGLVESNPLATPEYKGFDYFYGFHGSYIDKWTRELLPISTQNSYTSAGFTGSFVDLWEDNAWIGDVGEDWLADTLLEKGKDWLSSVEGQDNPFFLYYASDLPHVPTTEPDSRYIDKCESVDEDVEGICYYMLAIDEMVGEILCKVTDMGELENTLFVFASDNGGTSDGANVPFYGEKYYLAKGGYSAPAAIFGSLVPEELRGTTYDGMFHVTDWTPTLMHAATNGQWNGAMGGGDIDGIDQWGAVMEADGTKPRTSTLLYADAEENLGVVVDVDGVTLGYHMGTAWKDVVETTDTVSYEGEPVEVSQCVLDSTLSSTLALEAVSAIVGMHGATGATIRYLLLIGAMLIGAFALALRRHQGSKGVIAAQMRAAMGAKAPIADSVDMSYGTV